MELLKFHRGGKLVKYSYHNNSSQGEEKVTKESPEAPIPECDAALARLVDVVLPIMELPEHWRGKDKEHPLMAVTGFDLSHTKNGTRSIQISFQKAFRVGKVENYKAPMVQIDEPVKDAGESEKCALDDSLRAICNSAIEQAILYVGGTRAQMTLEGIQIGRADNSDPNQTDMDLTSSDPAEAPKKKPAKKAAKKSTRKSDTRTK